MFFILKHPMILEMMANILRTFLFNNANILYLFLLYIHIIKVKKVNKSTITF